MLMPVPTAATTSEVREYGEYGGENRGVGIGIQQEKKREAKNKS